MKRLVLAAVCLAACTGKYVRETTKERVEATPDRVKRGEYLVNQVSSCGACHTTRETGNIATEGERTDSFLGGGNYEKFPEMDAQVGIPNITGDVDTGIGGWSDDEVLRALRDCVRPDGRFLWPPMPCGEYAHMSDEDAQAVVAYLRTVPKVKQTRRFESKFPLMMRFAYQTLGVAQHPPAKNVVAPDRKDKVKYGEYVAHLAECADCHSLGERGPRDPGDRDFAGSDGPFDYGWAGIGKIWASNLTPDKETGLGNYGPDQIKKAIQHGTRLDGKPMLPPMSAMIPHVSGMTEEDLDALVAYLGSLKPVKNKVKSPELSPEWAKRYASGKL